MLVRSLTLLTSLSSLNLSRRINSPLSSLLSPSPVSTISPSSTSHATHFSDLTLRFPLKLFSNLRQLRQYSIGCARLDSSLPGGIPEEELYATIDEEKPLASA
ncbi:hypothetical protein LWI29_000992 [Acer saccharum]|uniref:Uncharacterized protein n=1 Tax=Acer saccharum TaxID=4024 RepID=A0AA39S0G9_ACESA|nr:hypothetical protein LWI29_000992 [Acer saccharum]